MNKTLLSAALSVALAGSAFPQGAVGPIGGGAPPPSSVRNITVAPGANIDQSKINLSTGLLSLSSASPFFLSLKGTADGPAFRSLIGAEQALGNPPAAGYILTADPSGARYWSAPGVIGGGGLTAPNTPLLLKGDNTGGIIAASPDADYMTLTGTATLSNKTLVSPAFTGTPTGLTKTMVGLSSVDNTSDASKNSAIATLTNKTLASPMISGGSLTGTGPSPLTITGAALVSAALSSPTGLTKADVGLTNVDNTTDALKPVSTATSTALGLKADTTALTSGLALKADATALTSGLATKEAALGNPSTDGYILSSTTAGSRSWIVPPTGGGGASAPNTTNLVKGTGAGLAFAAGVPGTDYVTPTGTETLTNKTLTAPAFSGTPTGLTKAHVGLNLVDNTSDAGKPVSTAQATALAGKAANPTTVLAGLGGTVNVAAGIDKVILNTALSSPLIITLPSAVNNSTTIADPIEIIDITGGVANATQSITIQRNNTGETVNGGASVTLPKGGNLYARVHSNGTNAWVVTQSAPNVEATVSNASLTAWPNPGITTTLTEATALTGNQTLTLPKANLYPAGSIISYFDPFTVGNFARTFTPLASDSLNGGAIGTGSTAPVRAGGVNGKTGTAYFKTDGATAWREVGNNQRIVSVSKTGDGTATGTFDLSGVPTLTNVPMTWPASPFTGVIPTDGTEATNTWVKNIDGSGSMTKAAIRVTDLEHNEFSATPTTAVVLNSGDIDTVKVETDLVAPLTVTFPDVDGYAQGEQVLFYDATGTVSNTNYVRVVSLPAYGGGAGNTFNGQTQFDLDEPSFSRVFIADPVNNRWNVGGGSTGLAHDTWKSLTVASGGTATLSCNPNVVENFHNVAISGPITLAFANLSPGQTGRIKFRDTVGGSVVTVPNGTGKTPTTFGVGVFTTSTGANILDEYIWDYDGTEVTIRPFGLNLAAAAPPAYVTTADENFYLLTSDGTKSIDPEYKHQAARYLATGGVTNGAEFTVGRATLPLRRWGIPAGNAFAQFRNDSATGLSPGSLLGTQSTGVAAAGLGSGTGGTTIADAIFNPNATMVGARNVTGLTTILGSPTITAATGTFIPVATNAAGTNSDVGAVFHNTPGLPTVARIIAVNTTGSEATLAVNATAGGTGVSATIKHAYWITLSSEAAITKRTLTTLSTVGSSTTVNAPAATFTTADVGVKITGGSISSGVTILTVATGGASATLSSAQTLVSGTSYAVEGPTIGWSYISQPGISGQAVIHRGSAATNPVWGSGLSTTNQPRFKTWK